MLTNNLVEELVINKDRLLRFGSELIFGLCEQFGTKVTILNQPTEIKFEEELASNY
jgi:putative resolvase